MTTSAERELILASSSPYRRRLLARLELPFSCVVPGVDETPEAGESADDLARRLGRSKALAVSVQHPNSWVIGSDQVAAVGEQLLGKPGNAARARDQLTVCSGRVVHFHTSIALARAGRILTCRCVPTEVRFRPLASAEIGAYVDRTRPFDCAGSFRWEGLGIALFSALRSDDPTALEGLPLIETSQMLRENGFKII